MPLPVGTWSINANGTPGMMIVGATSGGLFNGTVFGQPLSGFFNEADQEFSFIRVTSSDLSSFQIYYGTLFSFSPSVGSVIFTLGGTFRSYPPSGAVSPFEWSAQMTQKIKEKEGKEGKDKEQSKDTKDSKDRKDNKELGKEKEHAKEKEHGKELELTLASVGADAGEMVQMLAQRLTAVEQAIAVGQAFISQTERPVVGAQALGEKKPS